MKFLSTLILCSQLLIVSANQALTFEADCHNHSIFEAVDVALKSYNAKKEDGNQFVLHRITDARTRATANGDVHNFVDYEIREGSCGVKSGLDWQECDFLIPTPVLGICSAQVVINKEQKTSNVFIQNCTSPVASPMNGEAWVCIGCFQPVHTITESMLDIVRSSIERMNRLGSHPFHFDLENIKNAKQQVVSGMNYQIHYIVRQTNCSKHDFQNVSSQECKLDGNGQSGECISHAYEKLHGQVKITYLNCISDSGLCLNCPNAVEKNDPELLNLLGQVIDEHNANSTNSALFKLSTVQQATKVKTEKMYSIRFILKETNCSKTENPILGDECDFTKTNGLSLGFMSSNNCFSKIIADVFLPGHCFNTEPAPDEQTATTSALIEVFTLVDDQLIKGTCLLISLLIPIEATQIFMQLEHGKGPEKMFTSIKGLSPLRSVEHKIKARGLKESNGREQNRKKDKHGKKDKPQGKPNSNKHESSEESNEDIAVTVPAVPDDKNTSPNTLVNQLVTTLTPVQKCPGDVWQPILHNTPPTTEMEVVLLSATMPTDVTKKFMRDTISTLVKREALTLEPGRKEGGAFPSSRGLVEKPRADGETTTRHRLLQYLSAMCDERRVQKK
ncbi:kininogen-1 [Pelodytes ibericus]